MTAAIQDQKLNLLVLILLYKLCKDDHILCCVHTTHAKLHDTSHIHWVLLEYRSHDNPHTLISLQQTLNWWHWKDLDQVQSLVSCNLYICICCYFDPLKLQLHLDNLDILNLCLNVERCNPNETCVYKVPKMIHTQCKDTRCKMLLQHLPHTLYLLLPCLLNLLVSAGWRAVHSFLVVFVFRFWPSNLFFLSLKAHTYSLFLDILAFFFWVSFIFDFVSISISSLFCSWLRVSTPARTCLLIVFRVLFCAFIPLFLFIHSNAKLSKKSWWLKIVSEILTNVFNVEMLTHLILRKQSLLHVKSKIKTSPKLFQWIPNLKVIVMNFWEHWHRHGMALCFRNADRVTY